MKKFGAILSLVGLLSQNSAFAWLGGPYSNNTYDGITTGLFGGTIRGSNTTGVFKFIQNNEAFVSSFGDSVVYHKGMTYYGESYGQIDFNSSKVSGITNGNSAGGNTNDPGQGPNFRSVFGTGFGVSNAGGENFTSAVANSAWNGKITNKKFAMRFTGKGEMSFFGNPTETTVTVDTNSFGDFNEPRTSLATGASTAPGGISGSQGITSAFPGSGRATQTVTRSNNYPDIKDKVKIRVFGSRLSTSAVIPATYQG